MRCEHCGAKKECHKCDNCGELFPMVDVYGEHTQVELNIYFRAKGGKYKNGRQGVGEYVTTLTLCPTCVEGKEAFILIVNPIKHKEKVYGEQATS